MYKKLLKAGLAGGLTLIVWTILINGFFGFKHRMDMKHVPDEMAVYQILKQHIIEPGRYLCNPPLTDSNQFPDNEPVFSILYAGFGHEAASPLSEVFSLLIAIVTATICAFLLSFASERILSTYPRRVFFVFLIGLLITFFSDSAKYGIGSYPLSDTLIIAVHNIIRWTVLGAVIGLIVKPESKKNV